MRTMSSTEGEVDDAADNLVARQYQTELFEAAKQRNIIAILGTGTGKTFIAILLMENYAHLLRGDYPAVAKRAFFLVPTKPLAYQQELAIRYSTQITDLKVIRITGDMNVDNRSRDWWDQELSDAYVIVMVGQIFLDMLNAKHMSFDNVALLVVDEVHWAARRRNGKPSGHYYKKIMDLYNNYPADQRPRVLGLSATPINCSMKVENFESAITDIEKTYLAVCMTANTDNYGTNPEEIVWPFEGLTNYKSPMADMAVKYLDLTIGYLQEVAKRLKWKTPCVVTSLKKTLTNIRNMLRTPDDMTTTDEQSGQRFPLSMTWMGVWCASVCIDKYLMELEDQRQLYLDFDPNHSVLLGCVLEYLQSIRQLLTFELNLDSMAALKTASPKMHRLLEILANYVPQEGEDEICGIVFVNKRTTAMVLSEWLNELKTLCPEKYGFLKSEAVVGHSARPGFETILASNSEKQQQIVIGKFRRRELNLLVATSVLEEGLDVRKCNLVVRYDSVNIFRDYLQSKGRARAEKARFFVMTASADKESLEKRLQDFKLMEKEIKELGHRRDTDIDLSNDQDTSDQYFVSRTDARITEYSAIKLLYQYCQNLPSDLFTKLMPVFDVQSDSMGFKAKVRLPVNCPLRGLLIEATATNQKQAKRWAALKAFEELHKTGELSDNLLPHNQDEIIDMEMCKDIGSEQRDPRSNQSGDSNQSRHSSAQTSGTEEVRQRVHKRRTFGPILLESDRNRLQIKAKLRYSGLQNQLPITVCFQCTHDVRARTRSALTEQTANLSSHSHPFRKYRLI